MERNIYKIGKELFITNGEEIKEGDWVTQINYEKTNINLIKCVTEAQTKIANDKNGSFIKNKIILTTDQDLIKDNVQSIDDEFLEWFIENPSCEEVEVIEQYRKCCRNTDGKNENCIESINCEGWLNNEYERPYKTNCDKRFEGYKIIIPKEETKQETLEEVAEILKGKELFKESNDRARKVLSEIKSLPIQETLEWTLTNGEAFIMEGSKEVAKVIYPINTEEDFEKFNDITKLLLNAPKMENLLKDILNHIDSNLISLESSSYLRNDILKLIENGKERNT